MAPENAMKNLNFTTIDWDIDLDGKIAWRDIVYEEDYDRICKEAMEKIEAGKVSFGREYRICTEAKEVCWICDVVHINGNKTEGYHAQAVLIDISGRRALYEEKEILENALNRCKTVVFLWKRDPNGNQLKYLSDSISQFGYNKEAFVSGQIRWSDLVHPEDRDRICKEALEFLGSGLNSLKQEYRIVTKNNGICWVQEETVLDRNKKKQVEYIESLIVDVTSSKIMEEYLEKNNSKLERKIRKLYSREIEYGMEDKLIQFIRKAKVALIQEMISEMYEVYCMILNRETLKQYTSITGPKENIGIFYDLIEVEEFKKALREVAEGIEGYHSVKIKNLKYKNLKVAGLPIRYKKETVAIWSVAVLGEVSDARIQKVLKEVEVIVESLSDHFSRSFEEPIVERQMIAERKLEKELERDRTLLNIYSEVIGVGSLQDKLDVIMDLVCKKTGIKTGEILELGGFPDIKLKRLYCWEKLKGSTKCLLEEFGRDDIKYIINEVRKEGEFLLNGYRFQKRCQSNLKLYEIEGLFAMKISVKEKEGIVCFMDEEKRIWEDNTVELFKEAVFIMEKILNNR